MSKQVHKTTPEIRASMIADAKKMKGYLTHISEELAEKYGFSWVTVLKTIKPHINPDKFKRPLTDEVKQHIINLEAEYKGEKNQKINTIAKITKRSYNEVNKVIKEHKDQPKEEKMFDYRQFYY